MPRFLYEIEQRTEAWDQIRCGIPTASAFSRIVTPKGKLSTQAEKYMDELLAEWMYGGPIIEEDYTSPWMERGAADEADARRAYSFISEREVHECGFILRDDGLCGASPDGLVESERRILELKCPKPTTHASYMRKGRVEDEYFPQLQGLLWISEYDRVDIVSYSRILPAVIIEVGRDEKYISLLKDAVDSFIEIMLKEREKLELEYGTVLRRVREVAA